jgi:hypothetical protein
MSTTSTTGLQGSWKTTMAGVIAIVTAILSAVQLLIDNDPATNPDWTTLIAAIMAGIGLLFARDNNVTSEAAGATTPK